MIKLSTYSVDCIFIMEVNLMAFSSIRPGLHYRLVARIQFCLKDTGKARHHKARLFCRDTRSHWSHDSLLWYSGTIVQLRGK
jgi:hypothetical protein